MKQAEPSSPFGSNTNFWNQKVVVVRKVEAKKLRRPLKPTTHFKNSTKCARFEQKIRALEGFVCSIKASEEEKEGRSRVKKKKRERRWGWWGIFFVWILLYPIC
jgi:hypothetical protein